MNSIVNPLFRIGNAFRFSDSDGRKYCPETITEMIGVELSAKSRILREEETIGRLDSGSLIPILTRIL